MPISYKESYFIDYLIHINLSMMFFQNNVFLIARLKKYPLLKTFYFIGYQPI